MRAFKWSPSETPKIKRNGTGKLGCCCGGCAEGLVASISVQGSMSGELISNEFCYERMIPLTATTPTVVEAGCVAGATAIGPIDYECRNPDEAGDCWEHDPNANFELTARLGYDGTDWLLIIDAHLLSASNFCSHVAHSHGGDEITTLPLGTDPAGTHNLSFVDPNVSSIHYDIVVMIVL